MHTDRSKVALGLQRSSTALTGGGNGLSIDVIGHVARCEEAFGLGERALDLRDVTVLIFIDEIAEELRIWHMADGDEDALHFEFALLTGDEVLQRHGADFAFVVGEVFRDGAVPDRLNLGIGEHTISHDLRGAQTVAAMNEMDGGCELGQETGFLASGVPTTDHCHRDVALERTIAGGAAREATTDELLLIRQSQMTW